VFVVVIGEELFTEDRASSRHPKRGGNVGQYFTS